MKILNTIRSLIRENGKATKRPQKHDANLQKNSTLYFQVGLIVCLLAAYGVLEMKFLNEPVDFQCDLGPIDEKPIEYAFNDYVIYTEEPVKQKVTEQPKVKDPTDFEIVDDNSSKDESFEKVFKPDTSKPDANPDPSSFDVPKDVDPVDVPFAKVEKVPVFPGCEKESTNEGRRKCFETKMSNFINKKFNTHIASDYGLEGIQKIFVQFKVNKDGEITDIKARAPHPALEKEAQRVVDKLPKMTPGMQRDTPVSVIYLQPIKFKVQ